MLGPGHRPYQDHLQRYHAVESHLLGLVDHAHAAASQFAEDFVSNDFGK